MTDSVQGKIDAEVFYLGSFDLPVSPIDGWKYSEDELTVVYTRDGSKLVVAERGQD